MNIKLQLVLIVLVLIMDYIILRNIHKSKIDIRYAIIWILLSLSIFWMIIFPKTLDELASFLGIATPTNALFMISFFISYVMIFYLFKKISIHLDAIKDMNYELAKLRKEVTELKNERKND
ncbi:MAG: DUF2304 domain-containing protein [Erysipelotrichaceae bacterium]|nr:DUF2304 domain-containing protein [Erysipelotrichaceae bacterium]MDD3924931.1 DUF2304 domain-containing protein [Erysipelotrichaceae bacterium]